MISLFPQPFVGLDLGCECHVHGMAYAVLHARIMINNTSPTSLMPSIPTRQLEHVQTVGVPQSLQRLPTAGDIGPTLAQAAKQHLKENSRP
jgi:hypothetical protein